VVLVVLAAVVVGLELLQALAVLVLLFSVSTLKDTP
jgi:hypothetical protein